MRGVRREGAWSRCETHFRQSPRANHGQRAICKATGGSQQSPTAGFALSCPLGMVSLRDTFPSIAARTTASSTNSTHDCNEQSARHRWCAAEPHSRGAVSSHVPLPRWWRGSRFQSVFMGASCWPPSRRYRACWGASSLRKWPISADMRFRNPESEGLAGLFLVPRNKRDRISLPGIPDSCKKKWPGFRAVKKNAFSTHLGWSGVVHDDG